MPYFPCRIQGNTHMLLSFTSDIIIGLHIYLVIGTYEVTVSSFQLKLTSTLQPIWPPFLNISKATIWITTIQDKVQYRDSSVLVSIYAKSPAQIKTKREKAEIRCGVFKAPINCIKRVRRIHKELIPIKKLLLQNILDRPGESHHLPVSWLLTYIFYESFPQTEWQILPYLHSKIVNELLKYITYWFI